jgi:hypothetical protein
MTDPAVRPWWADVQHLRPEEDGAPAVRFGSDRERDSAVATLEREPEPTAPTAWWIDDRPGTAPPRELRVVIEEPLATSPAHRRHGKPLDTSTAHEPRAERRPGQRRTTEDWLAVAEPTEHRDPQTVRRPVEIRGQVDGVRGVPRPDREPTARAAAAGATGRRRPRRGPIERMYGRPDHVALWAFLLGIALILAALIGTPDAGAATGAAITR